MTVTQRPIPTTVNPGADRLDQHSSEAPLQAYIRQMHEASNLHNDSDEPVRGKDPWNGIGL